MHDEGRPIVEKENFTWEVNFKYDWHSADAFGQNKLDIPIQIPEGLLKNVKRKMLTVEVYETSKNKKLRLLAQAEGSLIKYIEKKEEPRKYNLIRASYDDLERQSELCPVKNEPEYIQRKKNKYDEEIETHFRVRGLPKMQIRLVYDTDQYPSWYWGRYNC